MRAVAIGLLLSLASGCVVVPKTRQRWVNDPTMLATESPAFFDPELRFADGVSESR